MKRTLDIDTGLFYKYNSPVFIVTGLPRSMTAWASVFLSTDGVTCIHEPETIKDFKIPIAPNKYAFSSSGLLPIANQIPSNIPIAYIDRDADEAFESFSKLFSSNIEESRLEFNTFYAPCKEEILKLPNAAPFSFDRLSKGSLSEAKCLFYFCHGHTSQFDAYRAQAILGMNIQSGISQVLKEF